MARRRTLRRRNSRVKKLPGKKGGKRTSRNVSKRKRKNTRRKNTRRKNTRLRGLSLRGGASLALGLSGYWLTDPGKDTIELNVTEEGNISGNVVNGEPPEEIIKYGSDRSRYAPYLKGDKDPIKNARVNPSTHEVTFDQTTHSALKQWKATYDEGSKSLKDGTWRLLRGQQRTVTGTFTATRVAYSTET